MSGSDKTWLVFAMIVAIFIVVFAATVLSFDSIEDETIAEMVSNGADPLEAACSVGNNTACYTLDQR